MRDMQIEIDVEEDIRAEANRHMLETWKARLTFGTKYGARVISAIGPVLER